MGGDEAGWRRKGVWWSVSCCGDGDVGLVSKGDGAGWRQEVALRSNLRCVERFILHVKGQVTLQRASTSIGGGVDW